jgi:outer membrane protein TolC
MIAVPLPSAVRRLLTSSAACVAFSLAPGAAQTTLTLAEAEERAVAHSFAMRSAQLDRAKADRDIKELTATGLPQVNLVSDYTNYIDLPAQVVPADAFGFPSYLTDFFSGVSEETGVALNAPAPDPSGTSVLRFGNRHTLNAGIEASQLLFSGSYLVGLQASKRFAETRDWALKRTEQEVRRAVTDAYVLAAVAEENVRVVDEALALVQRSLNEMGVMYDAGFVDLVDVEQLELTVAEWERAAAEARTSRLLARRVLAHQCGLSIETPPAPSEGVEDLFGKVSGADLLGRTWNSEVLPEVREQQLLVELAGLDVKNKQAAGLPVLSAFYVNRANAQRESFDFFRSGQDWFPVQLVGVNMSVPLWTSTGGKQRVEKARIEEERAEAGLAEMTRGLALDHAAARTEFENATAALSQRRSEAALAERLYTRTEEAFRAGVRSSFDLTQARNRWVEARGGVVAAQLAWLNARTRLLYTLS